jgi:hypothetical protein
VDVLPVRRIEPPPLSLELFKGAFSALGFEFVRGFAQINTPG